MRSLNDIVNEANKEFDEELAIAITDEITDIIDDIAKRNSPETIQRIIEDVLSRYICADDGVSNDTSIAVGDAVNNVYKKYF